MGKSRIVFRADGSSKMGLGHIIRSCALAQMLADDFDCVFIIKDDLISGVKALVQEYTNSVVEISSGLSLEEEAAAVANSLIPSDIVVLDGYHFTTGYQQQIKAAGNILVTIDDIHACHFISDVIVNHAGGITAADYSREWYTRLCLGMDFALLRKPFWPENNSSEEVTEPAGENVLITFGGADPNNDTRRILEYCIGKAPQKKYHVVIGAAYQHETDLRNSDLGQSANVAIYHNIGAAEMAALMKKSAIAITAPSTVSYEYLAIGGRLFLHVIADNQEGIYRHLTEQQMASPLSDFPQSPVPPYRIKQDFRNNFQKLFRQLQWENVTVLRDATDEDARLVYDWANDPEVRQQSFSQDAIAWEDHCNWFYKKIKAPETAFYIVSIEGEAAGQIRFDIKDNEAIISFLVGERWRGRGIGYLILKKGIQRFLQTGKAPVIAGYVKHSNIASCKAFEKLGFKKEQALEWAHSYKYSLNF